MPSSSSAVRKAQIPWHTKSVNEILGLFTASLGGFSDVEAKRRLEQYGKNALTESKPESAFSIFIRQFQSPLIYILVVSSVIVYFLGEVSDTLIILAVLFINAIIGALQEGKAQNTLRSLKDFTETPARVLRAGKESVVPDTDVVPGDILLLEEGDKVPADARIIENRDCKVNESSLTGESEPSEKSDLELKNAHLPSADQKNMFFKGTLVVSGGASAVVVATGMDTVIGAIARGLSSLGAEVPLAVAIKRLSRVIGISVLFLSAIVLVAGVLGGNSLREMFFVSIAIAVSLIPEGLPIVITLILARGVYRMGKRNALVKRLQAVDALGYASVIAVDKTGTITRNELMIEEVWVDQKLFSISGNGYEPIGGVSFEKKAVDPLNHPELLFAGKIAAFSSSARVFLSEKEGMWKPTGDPTSAAISIFARKIGFHKDELEKEMPLVIETPAGVGKSYHTSIHIMGADALLSVMGAPEIVLSFCDSVWKGGNKEKISQLERDAIIRTIERMSSRGLRVVASAVRTLASPHLNTEKMPELSFVALYAMSDVIRAGAREAVMEARDGGVKVVMITGDHRITAKAIAKQAGIWREGDEILTGQDLERMDEKSLSLKVENTTVFARVTPEHKLSIIKSFRKKGEVIAMTGDGVNDALSLVAADLGIAMGKSGTEVTKEAADIILLDDNFSSIVAAIEEGRAIYHTIKKVLLYLFSTGVAELFTILTALLISLPLPILPTQILWLNLVTDGFLVVALAMDSPEKISRSRAKRNRSLVDSLMISRIILLGFVMTVGSVALFANLYETDFLKASTVTLTALAVFQWFNVFNCRSERASIFSRTERNAYLLPAFLAVVALQLFAVYHPVMQKLLHTTALSFSDWLIIITISSSVILIEEVRKFFAQLVSLSPAVPKSL